MRSHYYLPAGTAAPAAVAPAAVPRPRTVVGLRAIADTLGISEKQLQHFLYPDRRRTVQPPRPPVRKVPGLGLAADEAALLRWRKETLGAPA